MVFQEGEILSTIQGQIGKKKKPSKTKTAPEQVDNILETALEGIEDLEENSHLDLFSLIQEGLYETDSSQESSFTIEKEFMLSDDDNLFIGQEYQERSLISQSNSSYSDDSQDDLENNKIFSSVFSDPLLSSQPSLINKSRFVKPNRESQKPLLRFEIIWLNVILLIFFLRNLLVTKPPVLEKQKAKLNKVNSLQYLFTGLTMENF